MVKCKSGACCIITCIAGALVIGLLASISFPVVNNFIHNEITQKVLLVNGTQLYDTWKEPNIPVLMQVYIFDLINHEEVLQGEKPSFVQRGPFTYKEHKVKVDITHYDNGTLSYKQISTYYFDSSLSLESENVTVTSVNIPLVSIINFLELSNLNYPHITQLILDLANDESIFIKRSVRELVWGYEEPLLSKIKKLQEKIGHTFINISSDMVGVLANKNNTDDGLYTIFTGEKNITLLGVIDRWNGRKKLDFWTTPQANMINGTDGTICPPFVVSKDLKVELFSTDICRSVSGVFQYVTKTQQGIELYRYSAPKEVFEKASVNPNNKGFCTPAGNCLGTGVLNVSVCQQVNGMSLPIVVSYPHFFMAEKTYQDAVIGLDPNQPHLSTDIDIEPHTGFVMQVAKRLQINIYMKSSKLVKSMNNLQTVVFPTLWVNESAKIDDATASQFKSQLLNPLTVISFTQIVMFAVAALLILLAAVLSGLWLRSKKTSEEKEATESLVVNSD